VTTHGAFVPKLKGRDPMNLDHLKCMVLDEADVFFMEEKDF
jgi:superfamily II DNA/RNA helicase